MQRVALSFRCGAPVSWEKALKHHSAAIFLALGLLLVPFMPSQDSLWIDEAQTWTYADQPDLGSFVARMKADTCSEAQMPFGMLSAWAGAQLLGKSEWQMRAQNMVWVVAALLCFFRIGKLVSIPAFPLLLAIQPFTWYYANEFRPYSLQVFSGSLICLGLVALMVRGSRSAEWISALFAGILVSCYASMLGVVPSIAAVLVVAWYFISRRRRPEYSLVAVFILLGLLLLPLGLYYLTTLMRGSGGAKIWAVGPANLIGALVEMFGFAGLLPARQVLRDCVRHGISASNLAPFFLQIAGACILFAAMAFLLVRFLLTRKRPSSWCFAGLGYFILSLFGMITLTLVAHFPFWGRHLAPAFPAFVLILGFLLAEAWVAGRSLTRSASILCCILLFSSSLVLRFSPAYSKDDYRSAAGKAHEVVKNGGVVWWAANKAAANYYGLSPIEGTSTTSHSIDSPALSHAVQSGSSSTFFSINQDVNYFESLPKADIVVLSKSDIYDRFGALQAWLRQHGYAVNRQFPAFTIWEPKR